MQREGKKRRKKSSATLERPKVSAKTKKGGEKLTACIWGTNRPVKIEHTTRKGVQETVYVFGETPTPTTQNSNISLYSTTAKQKESRGEPATP
jgi:hypothetical protein